MIHCCFGGRTSSAFFSDSNPVEDGEAEAEATADAAGEEPAPN